MGLEGDKNGEKMTKMEINIKQRTSLILFIVVL